MTADPASWLTQAGYRRDADTHCWLPVGKASEFAYSDGEAVEAALLSRVRAVADRSVLSPELQAAIHDWPSRYHLSARRANLLRPFARWLPGRSVLEIGAGCGALTRYLGECGAQVIALEGSPRRAAVAAARCADLANVTVVADTLQRFRPAQAFDTVTLVGVLEYARLFFLAPPGHDAVDGMLARVGQLLNRAGVLLLAIENQLGLKYFAGSAEDHEATPMFGIEDRYRPDGVVTFGRAELEARLSTAGLGSARWWFPFPDYKLPTVILSESAMKGRCARDLSPMVEASVAADPQQPVTWNFSLEQAWRAVLRNGLGGELANSLLVAAAPTAEVLPPATALAHHYASERHPAFAKELAVCRVAPAARRWWRGRSSVAAARWRVVARNLSPAVPPPSPLRQHLEDVDFVPGVLWQGRLLELLNEPGWCAAEIGQWCSAWLSHLAKVTELVASEFGWHDQLPGRFVDAVPRNLVVSGEQGTFIDLEWELEAGVEFGHLFYRGVMLALLGVASCAAPARAQAIDLGTLFLQVAEACGHRVSVADLERCHAAERRFQEWVHGGSWIGFGELLLHSLPVRGG